MLYATWEKFVEKILFTITPYVHLVSSSKIVRVGIKLFAFIKRAEVVLFLSQTQPLPRPFSRLGLRN